MDVEEIISAIKESPLTDDDLNTIVAQCTMIMFGNALMGAGMDAVAKRVTRLDPARLAREVAGDDD